MYRITFFINMSLFFTWEVDSYEKAIEYGNTLANFDLTGNIEHIKYTNMVNAFKAFRRKYGINYDGGVFTSEMSIDQKDESGVWWLVSDQMEDEPDYECGEMQTFDTE